MGKNYMILDEFDLDLPYVENKENIKEIINLQNCSYSEAIKIDYANTWKQKRRNFNLETRCITSMFERLLNKFKTDDCEKIIVECVDKLNSDNIINHLGVYIAQIEFDYDNFIKKSNYEKKVEALKLLMLGITKVAKLKSWDINTFKEVEDKIILLNYVNEWDFKKPVKSPNKKYTAEVLCKHEVDKFEISLMIKDLNQNIIKYNSLIKEPNEFAYAQYLGKVEWVDNNNICLYDKKGNTAITINLIK